MAFFSSIKLETGGGRTIEKIDPGHRNLLMYWLLTSTDNEYGSGFVRDQADRDSQLERDLDAAEGGHMYMSEEMNDLFGFANDLENFIYCLGFKLIFFKK